MLSSWSKHIKNEKDKDNFERTIHGSKPVLDRLKAILQESEAELDRSELDPKVFDCPNWAERQAFKNGYRSCLYQLKRLVDLDTQTLPTGKDIA